MSRDLRVPVIALARVVAAAGVVGCSAVEGTAAVGVRFATYNASMARAEAGLLRAELSSGDHRQIRRVAEILQRVRPDVVLLNEFDYDAAAPEENPRLFRERYLAVSQGGAEPIDYPHLFVAPVNTGVPSGHDLDGNGDVEEAGGDAFGFGLHPGQYGMVVLSRWPIDHVAARTFQRMRWSDLPSPRFPDDPTTEEPGDFLSRDARDLFRISSKSLWDVPIDIDGRTVHLLASHPTPPAFDGPEDRNGLRNHDEIRLVADYIRGADYFVDDRGQAGGLDAGEPFVIAGDLNADPYDGGSVDGAVGQLLEHPRVRAEPAPASEGGVAAAALDGGVNGDHRGDPAHDTADFSERGPGNLRVDYVLPSAELRPIAAGVFWPAPGEDHAELVDASDHRLVWVDVEVR